MCGVLDQALPVIGGVVGGIAGSVVPGLGTAAGAAIGAGLGGAGGNYAQTHNFGSALEAGALAGGTSYLGGLATGSLPLNNTGGFGGSDALGSGTIGSGIANQGPSTLGGLESGAGGAAMFGANAGTGTAIGGASGAMGGTGLGIAGGDALSNVNVNGFTGALGGTTGSGLQAGGTSGNLASVMNTNGMGAATAGDTMNQPQMVAGSPQSAGPSANPSALSSMSQTGSGAPMGYDQSAGMSMEGGQAAAQPGGGAMAAQGGYDTGTTGSGAPLGYGGVGGTGAPASAGLGGMFGTGVQGTDLLNLGKVGLGAWQQYQNQNAAQNYANSIKDIYSPTGAYAQQMQQTLARQDAKEGRNSQGGTRAVQLAAALAEGQSRALGESNYAQAAQNRAGSNALNGIFNTFSSPQGQQSLQRLGTAGFNGLSQLFS